VTVFILGLATGVACGVTFAGGFAFTGGFAFVCGVVFTCGSSCGFA
jgi:hypothetical protein